METFSTFRISRIFGIERTRLQEWLDGDFVKPTKKAEGKGTKTIFYREDLYRLQLFMLLLDLIRHRKTAEELSNISFQDVGFAKGQKKYYGGMFPFSDGMKDSDWGFLDGNLKLSTVGEDTACMLLINVAAVKARVDRLLEG